MIGQRDDVRPDVCALDRTNPFGLEYALAEQTVRGCEPDFPRETARLPGQGNHGNLRERWQEVVSAENQDGPALVWDLESDQRISRR